MQAGHRIIIITAQIGDNADLLFLMTDAVRHRLCRIMGSPHRIQCHILNHTFLIGIDTMKKRIFYFPKRSRLPDRLYRARRSVYGNPVFSCKNSKPADMIRMFVRNKNTVYFRQFQAKRRHTLFYPFAADAHIDQKMCRIRAGINTISAASAGNTA